MFQLNCHILSFRSLEILSQIRTNGSVVMNIGHDGTKRPLIQAVLTNLMNEKAAKNQQNGLGLGILLRDKNKNLPEELSNFVLGESPSAPALHGLRLVNKKGGKRKRNTISIRKQKKNRKQTKSNRNHRNKKAHRK